MADKKDPLRSLAAFVDDDRRVSVGGQFYDLAKLRPIDLAAARNHVVRMRIERHVETTRHMNFDPIVRAKTMAEIECAPLSLYDVMSDPDGRIMLIYLSLRRAGSNLSLLKVQESLDPTMQNELYAYVLWVSGVLDTPTVEEDGDGPLSTQPDSTPSAGT